MGTLINIDDPDGIINSIWVIDVDQSPYTLTVTLFALLDEFLCLILNENTLLLNFLSCFYHLVAFIWEF